MVACISTSAVAQKSIQDVLRDMESSNRAMQLEMELSRLRMQQSEAETARRYSEIERLRMLNESQEAANRAREAVERAAAEQAEAAKKAEKAAEELRQEIALAAVRTKNNIYLGCLLLFTGGFVAYVIRKSKKEKVMQESEKFGVVMIVVSALVMLLAVMISDNWIYQFDFLNNLMSTLQIRLFADEDKYNAYHIDVPTKYVVLACICVAAYGFMAYVGIAPAPKKKAPKPENVDTEKSS